MIPGADGGAGTAADIEGCRSSHRRLLETVGEVTDDDVGRPSRLPGWTVGHVLSHLARNADSHTGMLVAARAGEVADQYPGGPTQRADGIEGGARRSARELAADVATSTARLETTWEATPPDVWWTGKGRMAAAGEVAVAELPFRRWRETEIHHADLDLGFTVDDWAEHYVAREFAVQLSGLAGRLPEGAGVDVRVAGTGESWVVPPDAADPAVVSGSRRRLVAWFVGREAPPGAPPLGPWG